MKVFRWYVVIMLTAAPVAIAQAPDTLWTRTYGGSGPEGASSIQETTDGGFIIAASTTSYTPGNRDWWLLKTDANGDTLWTKTFGGPEGDVPVTARQTNDGGYIMAGLYNPVGADSGDIWLVKINAVGDTQWTRQSGTIWIDAATYAAQNPDNTYIVAGSRASSILDPADMFLQKLNSSGNNLWTEYYESAGLEGAASAQRTADGGYIVIGMTTGIFNFNVQAYLVKTNGSGTVTWEHTFGGDSTELAVSVQQTSDNGYIFCGGTSSSGEGRSDFWIVKTNSSGNQTWARTYGGDSVDVAACVRQTTDGGYIVVGVTGSFGVDSTAMWILKLNSSGDTTWTKLIDGPDHEGASAVQQTSDGNYIITGARSLQESDSGDVWIVKLASCADPTPAPPQIVSRRTDEDLRITWHAVRESVTDCPLTIDHYDVYTDSLLNGPFQTLLGSTPDTVFTVPDIISTPQFRARFFKVIAVQDE